MSHGEEYDSPSLGGGVLAVPVPPLADVYEIIGGAETWGIHSPSTVILHEQMLLHTRLCQVADYRRKPERTNKHFLYGGWCWVWYISTGVGTSVATQQGFPEQCFINIINSTSNGFSCIDRIELSE